MTALDELRAQLVELQEQRATCPGPRRGPLDRRIAETRDAIADMENRGVSDVPVPESVATAVTAGAVGLDPMVASRVVVPFERPRRRRTRGGTR